MDNTDTRLADNKAAQRKPARNTIGQDETEHARIELDEHQAAEIAAIRARIVERAMRCLRAQLVALGRDHERCGRASCARSRRCRGLACEPDVAADPETQRGPLRYRAS